MRRTLYPADQKYDLFHIKQSHISYVDLWYSLIFRCENRYVLLTFSGCPRADPEIPGLLFLQKRLHTTTFFRKKVFVRMIKLNAKYVVHNGCYSNKLLIFNMYACSFYLRHFRCTRAHSLKFVINIFVKRLDTTTFFERNTSIHRITLNPKCNILNKLLPEEPTYF